MCAFVFARVYAVCVCVCVFVLVCVCVYVYVCSCNKSVCVGLNGPISADKVYLR